MFRKLYIAEGALDGLAEGVEDGLAVGTDVWGTPLPPIAVDI